MLLNVNLYLYNKDLFLVLNQWIIIAKVILVEFFIVYFSEF